jgi:predicted TIM-barrel fold metal-dependent hydrolase
MDVVDIDSLLAPWAAHLRELVPGIEIFDAHTHLGQNDPDGMKQTPQELLDGLDRADAVGAFTFAMHEPDGYPPANDMVLEAAAQSDGRLIPFCRVSPAADDNAVAEARRALDAGARGIKLHPRAEQFTLDHPAVRELAAIAAERGEPMLVHAGRGIPALGAHMIDLAREFPSARFILAHAGITDLAWLWQVAPDHPNLLFDSSWWIGPDLMALFSLVAPGQILFASDAPYGHTLVSAITQVRLMLQAGLSAEQIRLICAGQSQRIAARQPLAVAGPAIGERQQATRVLLDRVVMFSTIDALSVIRGDPDGRGHEQLALARLACNVPDGIDDGPLFAAVAALLDRFAEAEAADPESRTSRLVLMLAAGVSRTPDVPLPPGLGNRT